MQICAATMENSMEEPWKIKNGTALWPSDFNSGYLSKEIHKQIQKNIYSPMFIAALFTIAKI